MTSAERRKTDAESGQEWQPRQKLEKSAQSSSSRQKLKAMCTDTSQAEAQPKPQQKAKLKGKMLEGRALVP